MSKRALLGKVAWRGTAGWRHGSAQGQALPGARRLSSWAWRPPRNRFCKVASPFSSRASAFGGDYEAVFRASVEEPETLWAEAAGGIAWHKPWAKTMERRGPFSTSWFVGGELNMCYNAIDRHVENGQGDLIAIIHDSPVTNSKEFITYKEVLEEVCSLDFFNKQNVLMELNKIFIITNGLFH